MTNKNKSQKHVDKRQRLVRIVAVVLCLLLVLPLLSQAVIILTSAKSSSELKKELDALKAEAQKIKEQGDQLESQLAENASETQTVIEQKSAIDQRIHMTEIEIENINAQIQQYGLLIAEKQRELDDAQDRLDAMNATYKMRIRAMEENGSVSYWSILFKANSFSDLLDRIDSIQEVAEADQRMLAEMNAVTKQIEQDRAELKEQMAAQQLVKDDLAVKEEELKAQRAESDALLKQLAAEQDKLSDAFEKNEDEEAYFRAQIMEAQAAYEKQLSKEEAARLAEQNKNNVSGNKKPTGSVNPSSSGFTSPLPSGASVTCAYGWRIHPLWGDRRFHNGVDLAASQGTPIYAIAAGTVTVASYGDANGYYVSLSHGNGYGSVYCHMTKYTVSVGDSVKQGEIIGYVGSTGWSTGPHLHFEIHKSGQTVNPMDYISLS